MKYSDLKVGDIIVVICEGAKYYHECEKCKKLAVYGTKKVLKKVVKLELHSSCLLSKKFGRTFVTNKCDDISGFVGII